MIDKLIAPVTGLLDKFIPDADEKAKLAHEIATMSDRHAQDLALAQIQLNTAEAASGSVFKGGWRPFIGWICVLSIAYHFILEPVIQYILIVNEIQFDTPEFDFSQLSTIVMAMLGMSTLRTYEKTKK